MFVSPISRGLNMYRFVAFCPNNHEAVQEGVDRDDLQRRILANEKIRLHCATCRSGWTAAPDLVESLKQFLAE